MYVDIQEKQNEIIRIQNQIIDELYLRLAQHESVAQAEINDKIYQAAQLRKSIGEG